MISLIILIFSDFIVQPFRQIASLASFLEIEGSPLTTSMNNSILSKLMLKIRWGFFFSANKIEKVGTGAKIIGLVQCKYRLSLFLCLHLS
jgi:hypothetical protein